MINVSIFFLVCGTCSSLVLLVVIITLYRFECVGPSSMTLLHSEDPIRRILRTRPRLTLLGSPFGATCL